jgi:hypothetical protein
MATNDPQFTSLSMNRSSNTYPPTADYNVNRYSEYDFFSLITFAQSIFVFLQQSNGNRKSFSQLKWSLISLIVISLGLLAACIALSIALEIVVTNFNIIAHLSRRRSNSVFLALVINTSINIFKEKFNGISKRQSISV